MPHVKLSGDLDLERVWQDPPAFRFSVAEEDLHYKYLECYLSSTKHSLILRYIVVEGRLVQYVQVLIAGTESGWIVKLDRSYPILRTAGVKLLLATIAARLVLQGATRTSTNLEPFEARASFYAEHMPSSGGAGGEGPEEP